MSDEIKTTRDEEPESSIEETEEDAAVETESQPSRGDEDVKTSETTPDKVYEEFFGTGTEEERLRMREIAAKLNIRDNDAIWTIIYVMNYFGRFYANLPEKMKSHSDAYMLSAQARISDIADAEVKRASEILGKAVVDQAQRLANTKATYSLVMPLSFLCLGVFSLVLIAFVAGAAVGGKGWGTSPLDAILNAPAGWIIPIALLPIGSYSGFIGVTRYSIEPKKSAARIVLCLAVLIFAVLGFVRPF